MQVSKQLLGTKHFVQNIINSDGILSLWRGATIAFLGQICENTTSFVLNAHFQRLLDTGEGNISTARSFFVGSLAGFFTSLAICPIETVKCRVQVAQVTSIDRKSSVSSIVKEIFTSQGIGIRGLYYGIFPQMSRDIHGSAIYFGCYDLLFNFFHNSMMMGTTESCILAGGFAGQIYWFFSLPMDRVKSIIQTQRFDSIPGTHSLNTVTPTPLSGLKDSLKVTKILYEHHGIRGFYQGGIFALIRAFPTNASLFYGYKSARQLLDNLGGKTV